MSLFTGYRLGMSRLRFAKSPSSAAPSEHQGSLEAERFHGGGTSLHLYGNLSPISWRETSLSPLGEVLLREMVGAGGVVAGYCILDRKEHDLALFRLVVQLLP